MWSIGELKMRGKLAMKANYWAAVLVALVLGAATRGQYGMTMRITPQNVDIDVDPESVKTFLMEHPELVLAAVGIFSTAMLISMLFKILVFNPVQVGCWNFYIRNSFGQGRLEDMKEGFRSWGEKALTMFLKDLFIFLWSLLFLIPGIIKGYSYMMVPFLLAENPGLSGTEALRRSQEMMRGQKWNAFMLDLSFLGWDLLAILTCGILWVFYVNPYRNCTRAELYIRLRSMQPPYVQWQQNDPQQMQWQ